MPCVITYGKVCLFGKTTLGSNLILDGLYSETIRQITIGPKFKPCFG